MMKVMCVDNYAPETDITYMNYNDLGLLNRNIKKSNNGLYLLIGGGYGEYGRQCHGKSDYKAI